MCKFVCGEPGLKWFGVFPWTGIAMQSLVLMGKSVSGQHINDVIKYLKKSSCDQIQCNYCQHKHLKYFSIF